MPGFFKCQDPKIIQGKLFTLLNFPEHSFICMFHRLVCSGNALGSLTLFKTFSQG